MLSEHPAVAGELCVSFLIASSQQPSEAGRHFILLLELRSEWLVRSGQGARVWALVVKLSSLHRKVIIGVSIS